MNKPGLNVVRPEGRQLNATAFRRSAVVSAAAVPLRTAGSPDMLRKKKKKNC